MNSVRRFWREKTGLFLGLWLSLMILGRSQMLRDPGTFWHTVAGRQMLASRSLIASDPFSFTFGGRPWTPHSWLAECGMGLIDRASGVDGLLLATVTTLAMLYTFLGVRLLRNGLHWLPTTLLLVLTIAASSASFHVRPQIVSLGLFAITVGLLVDFEAGRIGPGRLAWLIPLDIFWTNWHGAVLGGTATVGLAVLGWTLAWIVGRDSPIARARQVVWLGLLVLGCGLTALVNPYGAQLPAAWWEILRSPVLPRLIIEHAPPSPHRPEFWMILALGLVYAMVWLTTLPRWPRVTWLLPFVWLALSISRIRQAPLFGIATLLALAEVLPQSGAAHWLARPGRDLFRFSPPSGATGVRRDRRPLVLPILLVLGTGWLQVADVRLPILGRGWARFDPGDWPVELIPELTEADRAHPGGGRIFNDYLFGGFLIAQTPHLKVFIDDRCELYGDSWLEEFDRASTTEPGLVARWLREYAIDYALVVPGSPFDRQVAQQPGWMLLGRCPAAAFYGRGPR